MAVTKIKRVTVPPKRPRPKLGKFYGRALKDITPGRFLFRWELLRPDHPTLDIGSQLVDASWTDASSAITGSLTLRRPKPQSAQSLPIANGHMVRLSVRWGGGWYRLWTMRVQRPPSVDLDSGTLSVDLAEDMILADRGTRRWRFRKTKARKHGWYADEVTRAVCRKAGIKFGSCPKGTKRMSISVKGSPLDAIRKAWKEEQEKTNQKYIIRLRDGALEVIPLRRNEILYIFEEQVRSAMVEAQQASKPVTVIHATGRIGKGSEAKKVKFTATDIRLLKRLGRVEEEWKAGRVASRQELKERAQRRLAQKIRVTRTASMTVPGVPFLRRGDGIRWKTKEAGWRGPDRFSRDRSYVFITEITHSVSGSGAYTSDVRLTQKDPYVRDQMRRDEIARKKARERRKRR